MEGSGRFGREAHEEATGGDDFACLARSLRAK
jgi:hypothetical protein